MHVYEVRPRKDRRGFDLISDVLPYGVLWYGEPNAVSNAIGYAKFFSRSHDAVIRVYDEARRKMDLRRRNGAVMRHDLLFRKAFVSMESAQADSPIIRISCMRLSS
jgi:hypothetical protein